MILIGQCGNKNICRRAIHSLRKQRWFLISRDQKLLLIGQCATWEDLWSHALISDETHGGLLEHCSGSTMSSQDCEDFEITMEKEIGEIDFYSIYTPMCSHSSNSSKTTKSRGGYDPCEENYIHNYLNLPQVQAVLHANRTKLPYTWEVCRFIIFSWIPFKIFRFLYIFGACFCRVFAHYWN